MGRKQKRKQARRQQARVAEFDFAAPALDLDDWDVPGPFGFHAEPQESVLDLMRGRSSPGAKSCGTCREFVEDGEFGRGTCLHPGSGVFSPWDNTPGCEFHAARRR